MTRGTGIPLLGIVIAAAWLSGCAGGMGLSSNARPLAKQWRAVHFRSPGKDGMPLLHRLVEERLAPWGVNVLIFEVNFGYRFESHPELISGPEALSHEDVRSFVEHCRQHGIRVIPQFNCLGHQSWEQATFPLLTQYPEFDETPGVPNSKIDYCRSWCPLHPGVNHVVFPMMEELIEAFEADAFHVGLDEVFEIASPHCERCAGKDPAELYAKAINDYHAFLTEKHGVEMLMWGDRLIDGNEMGYNRYEASRNGTAPSIDMIPKDIIICDWHYGWRRSYPSVPYFQEKGFRVLPASWRFPWASEALYDYAAETATDKMLGHLCTTWYDAGDCARVLLGEAGWLDAEIGTQQMARSMRKILERMKRR